MTPLAERTLIAAVLMLLDELDDKLDTELLTASEQDAAAAVKSIENKQERIRYMRRILGC